MYEGSPLRSYKLQRNRREAELDPDHLDVATGKEAGVDELFCPMQSVSVEPGIVTINYLLSMQH